MNTRDIIQNQIKEAMRAREVVRLEALRYVWSRIKELEIDKKSDLNQEEVMAVITKEVKSRKEAIEQFAGAGREDLVSQEEEKLVFLTDLLPEMMSKEEVEKVVDEVIAGGITDFGAVMGQVMAKIKGKAEGKIISELVREKLS
jgi:uncharacterized protein YqeY